MFVLLLQSPGSLFPKCHGNIHLECQLYPNTSVDNRAVSVGEVLVNINIFCIPNAGRREVNKLLSEAIVILSGEWSDK